MSVSSVRSIAAIAILVGIVVIFAVTGIRVYVFLLFLVLIVVFVLGVFFTHVVRCIVVVSWILVHAAVGAWGFFLFTASALGAPLRWLVGVVYRVAEAAEEVVPELRSEEHTS